MATHISRSPHGNFDADERTIDFDRDEYRNATRSNRDDYGDFATVYRYWIANRHVHYDAKRDTFAFYNTYETN